MARVGDLATEVAEKLQREHLAVVGEEVEDEGEVMHVEARRSVFTKMRFSWRSSDQRILEQIRSAADRMFFELFMDAITILDNLYSSLRVPEVNEHGVVKKDSQGRVIWQKDSSGREIENWGNLTGYDIEKCLLDLTRLRTVLAPQVNELLLEASFAKHIADDARQDAYAAMLEGTVGDRNAAASRADRPDRYSAFFRYWLYSQADVFMKEILNFGRVCERIRYWRIEDGGP